MKKMLEYQSLDIELNKLKRAKLENSDKANLDKIKSYVVEFQNKGYQLEEIAKQLIDEYEKLKSQYEINSSKIEKLSKSSLDDISLDNIENVLFQINTLSSELFMIERNINNVLGKIKNSIKNFDIVKKNMSIAKDKYRECKDKCEKQDEMIEPKIQEIMTRMKNIEKELSPELFAKYKSVKSDKIFPVFVPLSDGHCSGCRVELPTAKLNKIKTDGSIVCECHRVIYSK